METPSDEIQPEDADAGTATPSETPRAPRPRRGWVRRVLLALFALALAPHLYLLALRVLPVPITLNMLGAVVDERDFRRRLVDVDAVAPVLVESVIAAEDSRFCAHNGIDWEATQSALDEARAGGRVRGASTLTQQTAKNVFFWNGGGWVRKAGEAWFALAIDAVWGKRRVLEVYLNVAEWGDGIYGVEAASRARFGKPAAQLTPREAALLAAVLPSPNKWRVDPPGPYVSGRAATLQRRAADVRAQGLAACVLD